MKKILLFFIFFTSLLNGQVKEAKDVFNVARSGSVEEMKALEIMNKDTINVINSTGFTPLILACYRGNIPVAIYLIKKVKNINYNSSSGTALAATSVKGNLELAKLLLENKADPNIADASGMTPLLYAIQFKNKELVDLLIKYKADKKMADSSGKSPFEYAVFTKNEEIINLFKN